MSEINKEGSKCRRNIVKEWEENREWLDKNGFGEELKNAVSELHALRWSIHRLAEFKNGDYELEGLASLIGTVASRLNDVAHGRLSDMTLPS